MANGERLARALGWFSIGLGTAQLVAPSGMARMIGLRDEDDNRRVMRGIGMRELVCGLALLTQQRSAGWLWARVGGDAMDITLLGKAMAGENPGERKRTAAATAAVVGVTALDVLSSVQMSRSNGGSSTPTNDDEPGKTPGVQIRKSTTIRRPREEVYAYWRDFQNLPRFMTHLESVTPSGSNRSHWVVSGPVGTTVDWDAEITNDEPGEFIAWRSVPGSKIDNAGSVEFRDAPQGRGTEIHVWLQYQPPAGTAGRLIARLLGEEPEQQVVDDLRRLKQVLETGEIVRSDGSPEGVHSKQRPAQPVKKPSPAAPRDEQMAATRDQVAVEPGGVR